MKHTILATCLIASFYSCENKSDNQLLGKYINYYERETSHYVELRPDSTFVHYYKKSNNPPKQNIGKWSLIVGPQKTEVLFEKWVDFGYVDSPACNGCFRWVQLKARELLFSYDLPEEVNFKKK